MPTVVDALLVELNLDASKFTAGTTKIDADLKKVSGAGDETAKNMELAAKKITAGFARVRTEILGLFALMLAGRGLKELTADITSSDAATGRFAKTLDMSTSDLAAWEGAAVRAGGTAEGIAGSLGAFSQKIEEFQLTGKGDTAFLSTLNLLHIRLRDSQGNLKSFTTLFLELSDSMKGMDPRRATAIGAMLHMDQGTVNLLEQGRAAVQALLDQQKKLGVPSDADAKRAQGLLNGLHDLQQAFESFGRTILNDVSPALTGLMTQLTNWIETNGPRLKTEITDKIEEFVKYLESIDWEKVGTNIAALAKQATGFVDALGGVVKVSETLFGLWVGAKFLAMLNGIGLLRAAIVGGEGGGLVGAFATLLSTSMAALGLAATLNGDTDPTATPDGFRQGWQADNTGEAFGDTWLGRMWKRFTGAGAGPTTEQQKALAKQAMTYFTGQGWTPEQAAGIVGNLQQESGFNPAAGAGTAHEGLAQWDDARKADIERHFGKPLLGMDYAEQLQAVQWELTQGKYKAVGDELRRAKTAGLSARVLDHDYFSPGNYMWEDGRRSGNAEQRLGEYGSVPPAAAPKSTQPYIPTAAQRWSTTHNHGPTTNDNSSAVNVTTLNINTRATDAAGIAAGFQTALASLTGATQMNRGLA